MTIEELAHLLDDLCTQCYLAGATGERSPKLQSIELAERIIKFDENEIVSDYNIMETNF